LLDVVGWNLFVKLPFYLHDRSFVASAAAQHAADLDEQIGTASIASAGR